MPSLFWEWLQVFYVNFSFGICFLNPLNLMLQVIELFFHFA